MKAKLLKIIKKESEVQIDYEIPINGTDVQFGAVIPKTEYDNMTKTQRIAYLKQNIINAYQCWIKVNPTTEEIIKDPKTELGINIISV